MDYSDSFLTSAYLDSAAYRRFSQWCKRLTRLTCAFSKKWENLQAALALHFAYYNLCRIHGKLRITPAMAAGVTDHVWGLDELIATL